MTGLCCFLIPKPFLGLDGIHQANALVFLRATGVEVLLLGDEAGCAEAAQQAGVRHLPNLPRNEHGTPLVNAAFALAAAEAESSHLCYLNADILMPPDLGDVASACFRSEPQALLTGARVDLDLPDRLDATAWEPLARRARAEGRRRYPAAMDYFLFPKGAFAEMPAFAIGRPGWDNWMVYAALKEGRPVVDIGADLLAIHQNHDYRHVPGGPGAYRNGPESQSNRRLAGGYLHLYNLRDATHRLVEGRLRPRRWRLSPYPVYRRLMHATTRFPRLRSLLRFCLHPIRSLRGPA